LSVLVQQTAEQVAPTHSALLILGVNGQPGGLIWRLEPERPVRAVFVVVPDLDPQDPLEVAAPEDQQPVQALGADGADPSLGVRVRFGRPHRRHQHLGTIRAEDLVEPRQNLASRSWTMKRTCQLMAEHQELKVVGGIAAGEQPEQLDGATQREVREFPAAPG
jgi:hypothetical protein